MHERVIPWPWVYLAGVALLVAGCLGLFVGASTAGVLAVVFVGAALVAAAAVVPRVEEGQISATSTGMILKWRRQVTERVAETLSEVDLRVPVPTEDADEFLNAMFSDRPLTSAEVVDINNDGEQELVIQHPVGAHSCELSAFGWSGSEPTASFETVAAATAQYTDGFTIDDFDRDGRIEIANVESDWSVEGATSAGGPWVEVLRRWDGQQFEEIARRKVPPVVQGRGLDLKWVRRP